MRNIVIFLISYGNRNQLYEYVSESTIGVISYSHRSGERDRVLLSYYPQPTLHR